MPIAYIRIKHRCLNCSCASLSKSRSHSGHVANVRQNLGHSCGMNHLTLLVEVPGQPKHDLAKMKSETELRWLDRLALANSVTMF